MSEYGLCIRAFVPGRNVNIYLFLHVMVSGTHTAFGLMINEALHEGKAAPE
jgi:hypothetical protein